MVRSGHCSVGFRSVLLAGLAAGALMAHPAQAAEARALNLPGGSLEAALSALAAQTGDQLVYTPDLVAGRRVGPLAGRFDLDTALARLLAASDIVAVRAAPGMIVLKRREPAAAPPASTAAGAGSSPPLSRPFASDAPVAAAGEPALSLKETPAAKPQAAVTVEAVEVTGSHIRGAGATASPLVVLEREDLDRSGHATLAEALNVLPQVFGGQNSEGANATNADTQGFNSTYATGVNLRGLGSAATLVLLNGRRLAGSGSNADFVDVSTLPSIAVARVEVLLDGASAIYGSDAVGGVVNVILRRDFNGAEVRLSARTGQNDTPRQFQLGAVFGRTWSAGGLLLAYEGNQHDPLAAADRPYSASADLRPFGGADDRITTAFPGNIVAVNPATGISGPFFGIPAGQNGRGLTPSSFLPGAINRISRQQGLDVLPGQREQSAYAAFHQDLGERVEISGDARWGFRAARTAVAGSVSTLTVTTADPFFVSPNGATREQIAYSFIGELPNPIIRATAQSLSGSLGGRARLASDWVANGYLGFAQEIDDARSHGLVNTAILAEALGNAPDNPLTAYSPSRDGFFNPFTGLAANPASVTNALMGFTNNRSKMWVESANLQADGSLVTLPGGDLKLALGVTVRREHFRKQGSSYTSTPTPVPTSTVAGARDVTALFAEARAPLVSAQNALPGIDGLELSAAVRAERYSDFGSTVDPKFGVTWTPFKDLRVRATYGTSFRAPGLMELFAPVQLTPLPLPLGPTSALTLAPQGGNPNLKPETAVSWTAGLDYTPHWSPGSRLSLTGFATDFKSRIDRPVLQNLVGALTDPRFASFIQHISPATNPADLALITSLLAQPTATAAAGLNPPSSYLAIVDLRYVNTGELVVRGLDLDASQTLPAWGGAFTVRGSATRLFTYDQALTPTARSSALLGVAGFPAKLRARLTADYTHGSVTGGLALNYLSAFQDSLGVTIGSQATLDAQLRLRPASGRFAGTTLSFSVRNIFDTAPPFYNNVFGFAYDPSNADVIGRFVQLQLTKRW
jgi:iron complex outermembrane receptor protein